jgi:N-methylhydantoinase B
MQLGVGDTYVLESGGGGGFGDPIERPIDAIAQDVRLGYISPEAARRDYAVVCDAAGIVDANATTVLRADRQAPLGEPDQSSQFVGMG